VNDMSASGRGSGSVTCGVDVVEAAAELLV